MVCDRHFVGDGGGGKQSHGREIEGRPKIVGRQVIVRSRLGLVLVAPPAPVGDGDRTAMLVEKHRFAVGRMAALEALALGIAARREVPVCHDEGSVTLLVGKAFHSEARSRLVHQPAATVRPGLLEPVQDVGVGVDTRSGRQVEEQLLDHLLHFRVGDRLADQVVDLAQVEPIGAVAVRDRDLGHGRLPSLRSWSSTAIRITALTDLRWRSASAFSCSASSGGTQL